MATAKKTSSAGVKAKAEPRAPGASAKSAPAPEVKSARSAASKGARKAAAKAAATVPAWPFPTGDKP
ncbi:MAG: hypothetical protein ACKO3C_04110 [Betaproteobacteria bacterium]